MPSSPSRHPSVPGFDTTILDEIGVALSRRAKAIKYRCVKFSCAKEVEPPDIERLNLDVETHDRTKIRLSVWSNGALWLGIHRAGPGKNTGWLLSFRGSGDIANVEATEVLSMFEETLCRLPGPPLDVLRVWEQASLTEEV